MYMFILYICLNVRIRLLLINPSTRVTIPEITTSAEKNLQRFHMHRCFKKANHTER